MLVGIPSDTGGGIQRGANLGPGAIRARLLEDDPEWPSRARDLGLVDLGDVFSVPQLLEDDMLSDGQRAATARALYPDLEPAERARWPVSPLSIAERALSLVLAANPRAKVLALGGYHSAAWPVVKALAAARPGLGIVQIDAHTDLLPERLGIRHCFATWSFHANELLGRGGRLVQVGTRASGRDRAHWESTLGVRQFWAEEVRAAPAAALDAIVAHVKPSGVSEVYFSNDIDGTDDAFADATGTPEPGGLAPDFVSALVARLGREVGARRRRRDGGRAVRRAQRRRRPAHRRARGAVPPRDDRRRARALAVNPFTAGSARPRRTAAPRPRAACR